MEFLIDLETIESYLFDDYDSDDTNEVIINIGLRRNSLLLAIAERLEAIALELEKKNVHPNMSAIRAGFCVLASFMLTNAAVLPQAKEMFDELVRYEHDNE